jgi:hypothetical protein
MRIHTLFLLLAILDGIAQHAVAQDAVRADAARIESAELSGLSLDDLSSGLRRDIESLAGALHDDERIDRLARRIEEEHPDVVAAVRTLPRPDGQVRLIFLVARISDDSDLVSNINSRYTVESVEIRGIPDHEIGGALRARLEALVGAPLAHDEAERLVEELEAEQPGYRVHRRIARGLERGRIRVVFEFDERGDRRWIPFTPSRSKLVYHSGQGPGAVLDIPMGTSRHRALLGFAIKNDDDLLEEYSGVRFGVESRNLGTQRLGARMEVSWLRNEWEPETLAAVDADPAIPGPYRRRVTVDPSVTVALTPRLRVSVGASLSELESLADSASTQMASAFVASVGYRQAWGTGRRSDHAIEAAYEFRSATEALESDLIYKRHVGRASYRFDHGRNTLIANAMVGRLTGVAPLFERFTLGDTSTLRGWSKFDLAASGGDRVFHQSLEYRIHHVGFFLDSGSVWTRGRDDMRVRFAAGFGLHGDNGFLTLGFPLNARDLGTTFMMGVRF